MICNQCGIVLPEGAASCPGCGAPVPAKSKRNLNLLPIMIAVSGTTPKGALIYYRYS